MQCVAQTHRMAITGITEDKGTASMTVSAEALGMPAALAETRSGSTKLEIRHPPKKMFRENILLDSPDNEGSRN